MNMERITYSMARGINAEQLAEIFRKSGIRRPIDDLGRMADMLKHANLLITAWDGDMLVGVARSVTDFSFCCYLSDLAVDKEYQHSGIGAKLIKLTRDAAGERANLLLLAAPEAMEYYPKVGFTAIDNGWIIRRTC
jgi:GNAT superfamily N-acetyltransferase